MTLDLERLQRSFKLNDTQQKHLEAFRWLISEEARSEGRTVLQAYVLLEQAVANPAVRIYLCNDAAGSAGQAKDRIAEMLRRMLNTDGMADLRHRTVIADYHVTYYPYICGNCRKPESEHVPYKPRNHSITQLKCPFAATYYGKAVVGCRDIGENEWHELTIINRNDP